MNFGPEITRGSVAWRADEVRPGWLQDHDVCMIRETGHWLGDSRAKTADAWIWHAKVDAIRLLTTHPHYATPAPATEDPAEAAIALVRRMVSADLIFGSATFFDEAARIAALPGFPAEVDALLVEAREMAARDIRANPGHHLVVKTADGVGRRVWGEEAASLVFDGQCDDAVAVVARLAALRRGVEIGRGG